MSSDSAINALATVTLIQMMATIGMGVTIPEIASVAGDQRLILRAVIANYVLVPAAAVGLLLAFGADPMAAAGLMMAAVCPGAPYGPPFTAVAKGNVVAAVGLMVILAGSSAVAAPLLLRISLPIVAAGQAVHIDAGKLVVILALSQFLPLCGGVALRRLWPGAATKLKGPFTKLSTLLNVALIGTILAVHFRELVEIRIAGYAGMVVLIIVSAAAGWMSGRSGGLERRTMAVTTSIRNVGVSLVIATASLPGTLAVTAATAFALVQTVTVALGAAAMGRLALNSGGITGVAATPGRQPGAVP